MNIYEEFSYRKILKTVVEERRRLDPSVNFQQMALHTRIPKSYLSRVIHGKADLNADQMTLVCQFLGFTESEIDYMTLLLDWDRSGLHSRKQNLRRKIKTIQQQHLETKEHLKAEQVTLGHQDLTEYYLDPWHQVIHISLAIPQYQTNQQLLAQNLGVSPEKIALAIQKLEHMGLVERKDKRVFLTKDSLHLPRESPVYRAWRNQIRLMSMQRMDHSHTEPYSFSVTFSGSDEVRTDIQSRFLKFIKSVEGMVSKSDQKNIYQLNFDLFPWD